ncbi:MAG TPA: DinB family protein [Actinomycetota bacterium]|nr:DinB family protein [Actinomycetota bacterium]
MSGSGDRNAPEDDSPSPDVRLANIGAEIWGYITATPRPDPGPLALLHVLAGAALFPLSRIMDGMTDEELGWAPVPDAMPMDWVPQGHDPSNDPFTTIGWRWRHLAEALHAIPDSLGPESPQWPERPPEIVDAESAGTNLAMGIRRAAEALAAATEERLDELIDNDFGRHSRRHWVTLMLVETVHHAAEVGVLRDLYKRRGAS